MNLHLSVKHNVSVQSQEKSNKILGYFRKYGEGNSQCQATSSHELTRDIVIWFFRDLLAFENVAKDGFVDFFKINCPSLNIPAPVTLAGTALDDVYEYFVISRKSAANVNLRRNPANPDISRKIMSASRNFKIRLIRISAEKLCQPAEIFFKIRLAGLGTPLHKRTIRL